MDDLMERYDELDGDVKERCSGVAQPEVVATLVLASIVREAGRELEDTLRECIQVLIDR